MCSINHYWWGNRNVDDNEFQSHAIFLPMCTLACNYNFADALVEDVEVVRQGFRDGVVDVLEVRVHRGRLDGLPSTPASNNYYDESLIVKATTT